MFEHIVLRRQSRGEVITPGQIAEALLYYQKVHLFLDRGTLLNLVSKIGTARTLSLLQRHQLTAVHCEESLGTQTAAVGVTEFHNYVAMLFGGHQSTGKLETREARLEYDLKRQDIPRKEAARFTREFLSRVPARKFTGDHFIKGGVINAAKADLLDTAYLARAIRKAAATVPGGYDAGEGLKVDTIDSGQGVVVFSNLDLDAINERRKRIPNQEALTMALLLTHVLDARADLALAAYYGGDFATSDMTSSIIRVRYEELLRRSKLNDESRQQFMEIVLPDSPRLAEVIDSGERSFDEFLDLLDKADRFKNWLGKVNPDEDLVRTYLRDVSAREWIERLPAKSLRYLLTLAIEAKNPIAGLMAGFADNFVVDKLFGGWRPNHFVLGELAPFVRS